MQRACFHQRIPFVWHRAHRAARRSAAPAGGPHHRALTFGPAFIALLSLVLLSPTLSLGGGPELDPERAQEGTESSPMPPNPMVEELLAVVEEETLHLRTLRAEAARTEDPSQRLEIERKVEAVKRETEVRLLGIQLEYAMREGRVEVAAYLEAAIASITAPPQRREPVPRPAPSPATAGRTEP